MPEAMNRLYVLLVALLLSLPLLAQPPVTITDLTVMRPVPGQSIAAGYFTLTNGTDRVLTLLSVEAPFASRVEIHETMNMNGMMHMHAIDSVHLEPGQSVEFSRGGKHLMFFDVDSAALDAGQVRLTFHFDQDLQLTQDAVIGQW